ncbi:FAD:protein FMN transferase [Treponema porcinum]|uniref:FAD:protein FMN transferase n=1 Tax=Treponema porcinum TaxID=261392 RepID=UPI003EFFF3DD
MNTERLYKMTFRAALLSTAVLLFSSCTQKKAETYFESMNTFMKVRCYGAESEKANEEAQKRIAELEALLSVTKPESEVYRLNHASAFPVEVSETTAKLLSFCLETAEKTDGAFNPCLYPATSLWGFTKTSFRIPSQDEIAAVLPLTDWKNVTVSKNYITAAPGMMFDFGAAGKGFAGDEAIKILKAHGIKSALLDLGGNIQTIGAKPDGSEWTVGIKNPFGAEPLGMLCIKDEAVITSGGYERFFTGEDGRRYIHIFDGRTALPVSNNVVSATAVGKSGVLCDALSTSLFVLGPEKAAVFRKDNPGFDYIIVTADKKIFITDGIARRFTQLPSAQEFKTCIIK